MQQTRSLTAKMHCCFPTQVVPTLTNVRELAVKWSFYVAATSGMYIQNKETHPLCSPTFSRRELEIGCGETRITISF